MAVSSSSETARGFSRTARVAAAAIALGAAIFAAASLRSAGVTIDEPALLYAGDRTLHALAHPTQVGALDFSRGDPPGWSSHFPRLPDARDPEHYPVLPALVAAITMRRSRARSASGQSTATTPVSRSSRRRCSSSTRYTLAGCSVIWAASPPPWRWPAFQPPSDTASTIPRTGLARASTR